MSEASNKAPQSTRKPRYFVTQQTPIVDDPTAKLKKLGWPGR